MVLLPGDSPCILGRVQALSVFHAELGVGLTIHYGFRLPGELSEHAVLGILSQLRDRAIELSFPEVSDIFRVAIGEPVVVDRSIVRPGENFFRYFTSMRMDLLLAEDGRIPEWSDVSTVDAIGFTVDPGEDTELATFGFMAGQPLSEGDATGVAGPPPDWHWHGYCKTQYASNVSEEHFVKAHTNLVALLDAAVKLGIRVEVTDEGEYWETRDAERLLGAVRRSNQLMARFGGALSDQLGPEAKIEGPIFDHPDFEHLEMEAMEAAKEDIEMMEREGWFKPPPDTPGD